MAEGYAPSEWENLNLKLYADIAPSAISQSAKAGRNGLASDGEVEKMILDDIWNKISQKSNQDVLDLGSGCGPLASLIMERCISSSHSLTMMDQGPVISEIVNFKNYSSDIKLLRGIFPYESNLLENQKFDSIILYGVIHYATDPIDFVYSLIEFLKPGGHLLIGDIPNSDKKRRFLLTDYGKQVDGEYRSAMRLGENVVIGVESTPPLEFNDVLVTTILGLTRAKGYESFLLPQPLGLPFCFTRDDLLVVKTLE